MVVVTGGLGFIGNELVRQLKAAGEEVVILDNKNRVAPQIEDISSVTLAELDLTDSERVGAFFREVKPRSVYHLAAIHYIPECNANPGRTLRVNVEGTEAILRAAAAAGTERFIFASSGAVYADSALPLTENSLVAPVDIYGWSKLFGEQLCNLSHAQSGMPVIICRLFNNYGPRETNPHIIPEIINQLRRGNRLKLGNISTVRDYIHTSDCAKALIGLEKHCREGVVTVNVASGQGHTVRDIIDKVAALSGVELMVDFDETRTRKFDKQTQIASIVKLESILGWKPQVDINEGLNSLLKFEGLV